MSKRPWFLEQHQMRVYLSLAGKEVVDDLAMRHNLSRGRVIDYLVRAMDESTLDRTIEAMRDRDAKVLEAWRESERCIQS